MQLFSDEFIQSISDTLEEVKEFPMSVMELRGYIDSENSVPIETIFQAIRTHPRFHKYQMDARSFISPKKNVTIHL
jgi:hypothetical protein